MSVLVGLLVGLACVLIGWGAYHWGYENGRFDQRYGVNPEWQPFSERHQ